MAFELTDEDKAQILEARLYRLSVARRIHETNLDRAGKGETGETAAMLKETHSKIDAAQAQLDGLSHAAIPDALPDPDAVDLAAAEIADIKAG